MSNARYENKSNYDPGRFRYEVSFLQQVMTEMPNGNQIVTYATLLTTRAIRIAVSGRVTLEGYLQNLGAASELFDLWNFVIRKRSDFVPLKDMVMICNNSTYTIRKIDEVDEPTNYIKLLVVKTDIQIST